MIPPSPNFYIFSSPEVDVAEAGKEPRKAVFRASEIVMEVPHQQFLSANKHITYL